MRVVATRVINAPPERVFEKVIQLDLMPERSTEAQRFEWLDGVPGEVGTSFRGWNRWLGLTWWTNGWITDADSPRLFGFETSTIYGDRQERTNRWTYDLQPDPDGTRVVETLVTLRLPIHLKMMGPFLVFGRWRLQRGMEATLRHLSKECGADAT